MLSWVKPQKHVSILEFNIAMRMSNMIFFYFFVSGPNLYIKTVVGIETLYWCKWYYFVFTLLRNKVLDHAYKNSERATEPEYIRVCGTNIRLNSRKWKLSFTCSGVFRSQIMAGHSNKLFIITGECSTNSILLIIYRLNDMHAELLSFQKWCHGVI